MELRFPSAALVAGCASAPARPHATPEDERRLTGLTNENIASAEKLLKRIDGHRLSTPGDNGVDMGSGWQGRTGAGTPWTTSGHGAVGYLSDDA